MCVMSKCAQHRIVAIVVIDVAGYSRLMGSNKDGTLTSRNGHIEVTSPIAGQHGGRIVGTAGDEDLSKAEDRLGLQPKPVI